ncbi:MAG: hypothetical protein AB8I08_13295 [Sandaracinaceae bacterium]
MVRLRLVLLSLSLLAGLVASGCATNPGTPDGSTGMDGSTLPGRDGGGPPPGSGPCGGAGGACCVGRICELGLTCGAGDACCIEAGGGQRCDSASDCCRGLACQGGGCCAPRAAACTGSSDCCTGLVCSEGACVNPDEDLPPGSEGCGGAGGTCCPGFSCRSGLVCNEGSCGACGADGQACCDGATACVGSLACDVTTVTCVNADPATACGEIDNACCPDSRGVPFECSGDLSCVSGTCLRPEDVGFEGAPCTDRGGCDPGLVCDRRTEPGGVCITTPGDCGMEGMMCCDLGGDEGECEGSKYCQFGECSTCRGPSLTCLLGGILPGQECCAGSVCRPSPLVPRCCMGDGGSCVNSLDCCGLTSCNSGACECSDEGSFCVTSAECCDGLSCRTFQCREDGPAEMCEDAGASCEASAECCDGLACSETRTEPTAPPVRQCCSGGSTSCDSSEDCCGRMECTDGECQCVVEGGLCDRDIECCTDGEELACIAGSCTLSDGCARETQTCTDDGEGAPMCCGGLRCDSPLEGISRGRQCCSQIDARCRDDQDCCGGTTCENESCVCVAAGQSCETRLDCCTGLSCTETSEGSGSYTCQTPPA